MDKCEYDYSILKKRDIKSQVQIRKGPGFIYELIELL